jgi:hypothetical protein
MTEEKRHEILMHLLYGFYVEVFYHKEHNMIKQFRSLSSVSQLEHI